MSLNIDAALVQAEQEARRLQQQADQEAAMAVALPLRFEQNMAAFRQCPPAHSDSSATRMASPTWPGLMMVWQFTGLSLI